MVLDVRKQIRENNKRRSEGNVKHRLHCHIWSRTDELNLPCQCSTVLL